MTAVMNLSYQMREAFSDPAEDEEGCLDAGCWMMDAG